MEPVSSPEGKVVKRKRGRPRDEGLGERRRREILDVAATVFADRGYRETDVQVIANELGLGKGTIYRYFPTKRDLFLSAVDRGMRRMQQQVDDLVNDIEDPQERVLESIRIYLAFFESHPEFVELLIQERAVFKDRKNPSFQSHLKIRVEPWKEVLEEEMNRGRIRKMSIEQITSVTSNMIYGVLFTNHFFGSHKSAAEQAEELLDILCFGILTETEREFQGRLDD